MKPGEVRTFRRGKDNAVVVGVGAWAKKPTKNGPIYVRLTGVSGKPTTVTNQWKSVRYTGSFSAS